MIRLFFSCCFLIVAPLLFGQVNPDVGNLQEFKKIPIPPSPNASAIGKFGDIPVSMSTGIPSINIPFYGYADKMKGLEVSVGLSYHAGGHKVEDMPSNVGLGWALNAGGVISRTMRGRPDEMTGGYLSTATLPYLNTLPFVKTGLELPSWSTSTNKGICMDNSSDHYITKSVAEGSIDGECDIFQLNAGNVSGTFFFRKDGTIQIISQSNIKIEFLLIGGLYQFNVTDAQGVKYIFDQRETTDVVDPIGSNPPVPPAYISAWYLSKIISADGQDEINFTYSSTATLMYEGAFSDSYRSTIGASDEFLGGDYTQSFRYLYTYDAKRISSISFPDGTDVLFTYGFAREDYSGDYGLTEVKIKNQSVEKKFVLAYSHFESPGCTPIAYTSNNSCKRLKLVSVTENDGVNNLAPYTFEYNATPLPGRNSKAQDWWGYYNAFNTNTVLTATRVAPPDYPGPLLLGADRTPSADHTKAWILEKIFYPTGGNTRFVYELNDGFKETTYRSIGGIRVKRTEDFDAVTGKVLETNYSYKKPDNTSSGTMQILPNATCYWTGYFEFNSGLLVGQKHIMNELTAPGQTLSSFNGSPVVYTRVKAEKNSGGVNNGYSIHEFTGASASFQEEYFPFVPTQNIDWSQGLPLKETYYNSNNDVLRVVENEYQYYSYCPLITDANSRNLVAGLMSWANDGTPGYNLYGARTYTMCYGRAELKKTTETVYTQPGTSMQNVTEYTYDNQYFVPRTVKTTNSQGYTNEVRKYYSFDYNTSGLPARTALMNNNMVGNVVSTEVWEQQSGNWFLKSLLANDFNTFSALLETSKIISSETTDLLPESTVGTFNPGSLKRHTSLKDQVEFTAYDSRGRYTGMMTVGQQKNALIWGAGNNYPVATVKNAVTADVAYTSFETDHTGSWANISSGNIVTSKGATGRKFYSGTFSLLKQNLNAGTAYFVTYWSKSGAFSATGTQSGWPKVIQSTVIDGNTWNCYEHRVTGNTDVYVSGTGDIDELRLYPVTAQMNTITYNPLTGITSQCDARNYITYYEYDGFFRLSYVRDMHSNILKKICYNYYNTPEDCSGISATPKWQPYGNVLACEPCPANGNYYTENQLRYEVDANPLSPTYNTYRWFNIGKSNACLPSGDWQTISTACEQLAGVNTGILIIVQQDMNPCSPTYNQTRNVRGKNHTVCPPPGCNEVNCVGPNKKCVNGSCETGVKVYTASTYNPETGMYDCTYHYEWSDNSWSQDYIEQSAGECPIW